MGTGLITSRPKTLQDQDAQASLVLTIGTFAWRAISYWEHADFLLSVKQENFAVMFEFFDYGGWALFALLGGIWFFWAAKIKDRTIVEVGPSWGMVIASAIVAFLFGSLITIMASSGVPSVITSWGGNANQCASIIDTSRLSTFRHGYKLVLICGISDPKIDLLNNDKIMISQPFEIAPGGVHIVTDTVRQQDKWKSVQQPGISVQIWVIAVLFPSGISIDKINTLQDVINLGGKIIAPQYWS
jgi:hypothetical protein